MKSAASLLGLVIVLAIGYWIYKAQLAPVPGAGKSPQETIDTTGVTTDLVTIGQAERLYAAAHGNYGTLSDLEQDGGVPFTGSSRHGYRFTIDVQGTEHFKATAAPSDSTKTGWPTFSIDETMQVSRQ